MRIHKSHNAWLALMVVVAGCGGNTPVLPKLMPVGGTVTLDGKPLSGAAVTFIPTGSTRGIGANGHTDKAGKYEIVTNRGGKGTPEGTYKVLIAKLVMPDGSDFPVNSNIAPIDSPARQILPAFYSEVHQTVLAATVQEGPNSIDFPLSSKPSK
jgi:hypothetical protein